MRSTIDQPQTTALQGRRRQAGLGVVRLLAVTAVTLLTAVTLGDHLAKERGAGADLADDASLTAVCTFTNPAHAGECVETTEIPEGATAEKACQAILECLNNPRCIATHCNASTLRTGWTLKKSEER